MLFENYIITKRKVMIYNLWFWHSSFVSKFFMKANYRNLEVDSTIYEKSVIVEMAPW